MADLDAPRTYPGDPNPPAKAPETKVAQQPASEEGGGAGSVDLGAQESGTATQSRPAKAVFRVSPDEDGKQSVYMMDDKLETTNLGHVNIGDADELLHAVGTFNPSSQTWTVPEKAARELLAGDMPIPDYVPAKYRANKAVIANGLIWTDWLRGKIDLEEAQGRGDLEQIKMQIKEAPLFVYQGSIPKTVAKMWSDLKEAGPTGAFRRVAGETAGQAAFMTDAPMAAAFGIGLVAPVIASRGVLAPAAVTGLAFALENGLVFKRSYEIEGGNAAGEMIAKGFDEATVKKYAPMVGVVNGVLETVGFHMIPAPYKRVIAAKLLGSGPVKKAMAKAYVNYMKELGVEATTEVAQEMVNVYAETIAAETDGKPGAAPTGEQALNRYGQVFLATMLGTGGTKVAGAVVEGVAGTVGFDKTQAPKAKEERAKKVEAALKPVETVTKVTEAEVPAAPATETTDSSGDYFPTQQKAVDDVDKIVKMLDEGTAAPEQVSGQIEATLSELDAAPQTYGEKVIDAERKALIETRRRELVDNQAQITALQKEQARYEKAEMGTKVIEGRIDKLLEKNADIRGDIEFYDKAVPQQVGIEPGETLSMKPATMESLLALGEAEGRKDVSGARRKKILDVAQRLDLTEGDIKKLVTGADLGRSETTFRNWFEGEFKPAAKEVFRRKVTMGDVRRKQAEKRLVQEVNVRRQNELPSVEKMTVKELRDYIDLLDTFDKGDKVLSPRRAETLKTTDYAGARTMGEVAKRATELWGYPADSMSRLLPEPSLRPDITRGMDRLAARSPAHKAAVLTVETAIEAEDLVYMAEHEKLMELGAKALASRKGLMGRLLDPTMPAVVAHLEADDGAVYAGQVNLPDLTDAEQKLVDFIDAVYGEKLKYLQTVDGLKSRFANKYFTHVKRHAFEIIADLKDAGFKKTLTELYESAVPSVINFSTVKGGKNVGLRAHMKQTMFRTGELKPSKNVVRVVDGYLKAFHKKKALDRAVPQVDTVVDAAIWVDKDKTNDGEARKVAFDEFIGDYLNQKKGQTILARAVPHGGLIDLSLRTLMSLPSWAWIAANPKLQIAAKVGEVLPTIILAGPVGIANAWRLRVTGDKAAAAYLKNNEGFTGQAVYKRVFEAGQTLDETAGLFMYGILQQHRVDSMKDVLLALSTKEEIASGKISAERLAEIKVAASRWIDVKGAKSVLGATSPGALVTQFKGWALPIIETTSEDALALAKQLSGGEKMTEVQKTEVIRLITTGAVVTAISALAFGGVDEDDDSWTAQFLKGLHREIFSVTGGANPFLVLALPPALTYYARLLKAVSLTWDGISPTASEKARENAIYKTGEHEGELKGPREFYRLLPGRALARQMGLTDEGKEK